MHHGVYITNAANWFENTNFEITLNIDGTKRTVVASSLWVDGELGCMNTTGSEGNYVTTVEMFFAYDMSKISEIKIGFAARTPGDTFWSNSSLYNPKDYFIVDGHWPTNDTQQIIVENDGLLA